MTEIDFKNIDMFVTIFLMCLMTFVTLLLCYLEYCENKRIEESRRRRLEWRERRREGTRWETRN